MVWLTVTEYLCHKWLRICSVCHNPNPVRSSFMAYHTRATRQVPLEEQVVHPGHLSSALSLFQYWFLCSILQIIVCCFVFSRLAIVMSVLRFMASGYPFDIVRLFKYFPWQWRYKKWGKWDCPLYRVICYVEVLLKEDLTVFIYFTENTTAVKIILLCVI
jgi:hypothetical protein